MSSPTLSHLSTLGKQDAAAIQRKISMRACRLGVPAPFDFCMQANPEKVAGVTFHHYTETNIVCECHLTDTDGVDTSQYTSDVPLSINLISNNYVGTGNVGDFTAIRITERAAFESTVDLIQAKLAAFESTVYLIQAELAAFESTVDLIQAELA
eukprot:scaffold20505_cov36-Cyclotella_meneghiniana.AAC.1